MTPFQLGFLARESRRWPLRAMLALGLAPLLLLADARASDLRGEPTSATQCVHAFGKTACGYACKVSDSQVRCAQTPQGVCSVGSGIVACWDPPPLLRTVFGGQLPRPTCITSSGQTACGYQCVSNYDRVLCAQTPLGACKANEGRLVCWDPPAQVIASRRERTPQASCASAYGKVACGYNCVANHGVVRCSETPDGTCREDFERVFCWDPPLEATAALFAPSSELACMNASEERSCGFRCLAIANQAKCGASRGDSCRLERDTIVCAAPEIL
jgi:hypothetical protein